MEDSMIEKFRIEEKNGKYRIQKRTYVKVGFLFWRHNKEVWEYIQEPSGIFRTFGGVIALTAVTYENLDKAFEDLEKYSKPVEYHYLER